MEFSKPAPGTAGAQEAAPGGASQTLRTMVGVGRTEPLRTLRPEHLFGGAIVCALLLFAVFGIAALADDHDSNARSAGISAQVPPTEEPTSQDDEDIDYSATDASHSEPAAETSPAAAEAEIDYPTYDPVTEEFSVVDPDSSAILGVVADDRFYRATAGDFSASGFTLHVRGLKNSSANWSMEVEAPCELDASSKYNCRTAEDFGGTPVTFAGNHVFVFDGLDANPTARLLDAETGEEIGSFTCPDDTGENDGQVVTEQWTDMTSEYLSTDDGLTLRCRTSYTYYRDSQPDRFIESTHAHSHRLSYSGEVIDE